MTRLRGTQGLFDLILAQLIPLGAMLGVTFLTAVFLGPSGRGELALVTAASSLFGSIASLSLHIGVTQRSSGEDLRALGAGLRIALMCALAVEVGMSAVALTLPSASSGLNDRENLLLVALGSSMTSANVYVLRTVQALGAHATFRNAVAVQSSVYLVGGVLVAALTSEWVAVVAVWLFGTALSLSYGLRAYTRRLNRTIRERLRSLSLESLIKPSLAAHFGLMGPQLMYRSDLIVLGLFASPAVLGVYSIGKAVAEMSWPISEAISLKAYSDSIGNPTEGGVRDALTLNAGLTLGLGLGIGVAATVAIPRMLPLFADAVPVVWLLLPGVYVQGFSRISIARLIGRKKNVYAMSLGFVSMAVCVVYAPALLLGGPVALAICVSVTYALHSGLVLMVYRRTGEA